MYVENGSFHLTASRANSDPVIHDKKRSPTWITTNLYPSSYYGDVFCQLMLAHHWSSLDILLDENSAGFYKIVAQLTNSALQDRNLRATNTVFSSAEEAFDFQGFLGSFAARNRGKLHLCLNNRARASLER